MSVTFCSSGKTEQNSVRAGGHCLRLASGRTTRSLEKLNSAWWANGHWMDWPDTSLCLGSGERLIIADESCLWNKSPVGHFPLSAVCFKLTGKLVDAQQTVHILKTLGRFTKGIFFCQFFITLSCDTFHLQSIEHWKILLKMITKRKMLHVSFFSSAIEWVVNELYSAITYCTFESNPLIMINQFAVTTKVVRAQEFALSTIVAVFIDITVFIADGWLGL